MKMKLKRLEMEGFKSFCDKTVLELHDGITAIVKLHLRGGLDDPTRLVFGEKAELRIGEGAGLFEQAESVDKRAGHAVVGDIEVVKGALRLGPVIPVGRHLDFTHRVRFGSLLAGLGVFRRHGVPL